MRILVVGASGQVGRALVSQARARGEWVLAAHNSREPRVSADAYARLDKTDPKMVEQVVSMASPDVVIDTGAMHNVDYCEQHFDEALRVNRDGTRLLVDAAASRGARFVFVSTDFVFDGTKIGPYSESDAPRPLSRYAESKLQGERAVAAASSDNLVVRPSVIYSWIDTRERATSSSGKGLNFGTWLVDEVGRGRSVRIIQDQIASPTIADDLAGAIGALISHRRVGTYHAAGSTPVDRFEFSRRLVLRLGLDADQVQPVRTADLRQVAVRPANSSLSSDRLAKDTGYEMLSLDRALDRFAAQVASDPGAPRRSH